MPSAVSSINGYWKKAKKQLVGGTFAGEMRLPAAGILTLVGSNDRAFSAVKASI